MKLHFKIGEFRHICDVNQTNLLIPKLYNGDTNLNIKALN